MVRKSDKIVTCVEGHLISVETSLYVWEGVGGLLYVGGSLLRLCRDAVASVGAGMGFTLGPWRTLKKYEVESSFVHRRTQSRAYTTVE